MVPGNVVIVLETNQVGCVQYVAGDQCQVLLKNGELWTGSVGSCRENPTPDEIAATVLEVEKKPTVKVKKGGKRYD